MATRRRRRQSASTAALTGFEPEWIHDVAPIERLRSNLEILVDTLSDGVARTRTIVKKTSSMQVLEEVRERVVAAIRAFAVDPKTPQSQNLIAALIYEAVRDAAREIPTFAVPDADLETLHRDRLYRGVLGALDNPTTLVSDKVQQKLGSYGIEAPQRFDEALPLLVKSAVIYSGVRPGRSRTKEVGRPKVPAAQKVLEEALDLMGLPCGERERRQGRAGQRVSATAKVPKTTPPRRRRSTPGA